MFLIDFHNIVRILQQITAHLCKVIKIIATFAKNRNEMKVERETAGFALPFTAGVLLASYCAPGIIHHHTYIPIAVLPFLATSVLMHRSRRYLHPLTLWLLIGAAALSAGMICGFTSAAISISHIGSSLLQWAEGFGTHIQDAIDSIPFRDKYCNALAKALVTGERSGIPKELATVFRESGASHILALSGLHLGIIYGILSRSLAMLGNYRKLWIPRSAVIISACGFYTLATGAGPSIVRAFLFILLAETGRMTHRHHSTGQLLFSALVLQLTFAPSSVTSAGFQLSYAAMAGIAFILPRLEALWPGNIYDDSAFTRCIRKIWKACALSLSCQMTTAPMAYLYFGSLPKHFLLTNLLALPLAGLIIPAVLATTLLHSLGICPVALIRLTEALISALTGSLGIISGM